LSLKAVEHITRKYYPSNSGKRGCEGLSGKEREALIHKYAPMVKYIANRIAMRVPPNISLDDLVSAGILGLLDAIDKFDPKRDVQFKTYAEFRIKGAIIDELRSHDWLPRSVRKQVQKIENAMIVLEDRLGRVPNDKEIADEMGISTEDYYSILQSARGLELISIDELIRDGRDNSKSNNSYVDQMAGDQDPSEYVRRLELKHVISEALKTLTKKEQMVISLYYYDELTLKEIGEVMGLTESRISQIHTKAILKLRIRLRSYYEA